MSDRPGTGELGAAVTSQPLGVSNSYYSVAFPPGAERDPARFEEIDRLTLWLEFHFLQPATRFV
jgi:hypothetical protein